MLRRTSSCPAIRTKDGCICVCETMPWNVTSWNFRIAGTPSAEISSTVIAPSGGNGEVSPSRSRMRIRNEITSWAVSMRWPPPAFHGSRMNGIGSSSRSMAGSGKNLDRFSAFRLPGRPTGYEWEALALPMLPSVAFNELVPLVMPSCMRPIGTRPSFFSIHIFAVPMGWWSKHAFNQTAVFITKWTPCPQ